MVPDLVNKYLKMWLWILISLEIITKVHGYSDGRFPESCDSMLPEHRNRNGISHEPQRTEPPFEITYDPAPHGQPITVYLKSKQSNKFTGFMLEARMGMEDVGPAVGKFIVLDSRETRLLSCNGLPDNAVSQRFSSEKSLLAVNWTAQGENLDYTFRATFLQYFDTFWERVDLVVKLPAPSPTTTSTPSTTTPITRTPTTTSTTMPTTTTPITTSTTTPITKTPITTSTTMPTTTTPSTTSTTTPITTSTTTPIATKPTLGSTMPSSTSTNEPDTTEPSTAKPSRTTQEVSLNVTKLQEPGTVLMIADSVLVAVKMELPLLITLLINGLTFHHLNKVKILSRVLCAAVEIPALVLFSLADPINVLFIALVCVAIAFNFMELFIICLRIEPSHELKEISELIIKVCSVIHWSFTTALIFLGVLKFDNCGKDLDSWLVKVMIAYTVWILLFVIWVYVSKIGEKKVIVIAVQEIIGVGNLCFAFAVSFGIFWC